MDRSESHKTELAAKIYEIMAIDTVLAILSCNRLQSGGLFTSASELSNLPCNFNLSMKNKCGTGHGIMILGGSTMSNDPVRGLGEIDAKALAELYIYVFVHMTLFSAGMAHLACLEVTIGS